MNLQVKLTWDEYQRLQRVASAERRPLKDQAAYLIARGLDGHAGVPTDDRPTVSREPEALAR